MFDICAAAAADVVLLLLLPAWDSYATVAGSLVQTWVGSTSALAVSACPESCDSTPTLACLACTVRTGGIFSYRTFTTPGSTYTLRFTFSEVEYNGAGNRAFDVLVNGLNVLTGVDPFALAGAKFKPALRTVTATAGAGAIMHIGFVGTQGTAMLSALEVCSADSSECRTCGFVCVTAR
jgi:hypothetical protein